MGHTLIRKLSLPVLVVLSFLPRIGWSTEGMNPSLFKPANPSNIHVPLAERGTVQFLEMDRSRFEGLASWKEFTCLIPNFPLASDGNYNLRVEQFDAVSKDIKGKYPVPAHVFFRGSVDGIPESHVCLTIYEDCAWGYINAGDKTYAISGAGRTETGNLILGVVPDSTQSSDFACGVEESRKGMVSPLVEKLMAASHPKRSGSERTLTSSIPQFSIGLEMDYPCVQHCGGTAIAAFKYGLAVIAAASDIYIRDAGMCLVCATHFEWETPDNYIADTACDLLYEFDGTNIPPNSANLAMYVLMSGRSLNWCGGIANSIGVLCQGITSRCICGISNTLKKSGWDYPYHTWTWDIMVSTHEMGHLVACMHTFNCAWNPPLDSCVAAEGGDCYDVPVPSKGTIMSYCHTTPAGAILKFHPRCVEVINEMVTSYSCGLNVSIPQIAISPQKQISECTGGEYRFTLTGTGSQAPYVFEVNPAPDSLIASGSNYTAVINPFKAQKFYVRLTDGASVRVYDSIMFVPLSTFGVKIRVDSASVSSDSAILIADVGDTTALTFYWYKLPNALGTTSGLGPSLRVGRNAASKYSVKVASAGGCVSRDTVLLPAGAAHATVDGTPVRTETFRMFPNPAFDRITASRTTLPAQYWVEDVLGRHVDVIESASGASPFTVDFDVARLRPGSYWMVREMSGRIDVSAFQKQ